MDNKNSNSSKAKYKIVGKGYQGIEIVSYTVENDEGVSKCLDISTIIKLARNNRLTNAKAILNPHTGEYMVAIEGGLDTLPVRDKTTGLSLQILARVMSDGQCIGYKVTNGLGKYYKYSPEKVWDLAEKGVIPGLEAKVIGHCKALIGSEVVNLINLPKIDG